MSTAPSRVAAAGRGAAVAFAALLVVLFAAVVAARAEPYVLQPGDTLRLSISEVPTLDIQSTIDIDGNIQVPRIGLFPAAGQTIAELQASVSLAAAGKTLPLYSADGTRREVTLVGTEIAVEVVSYRPVYVSGDVARPGAVGYVPGLTVRAAIASVGGLSEVPTLFEDALMQAPDLQAAYQTAALDHAAAVIRLWGIDATLAGRVGDAVPPRPVHVGESVVGGLFAVERRRVELALNEARTSRAGLSGRLAYLTERVARLGDMLRNSESALSLEEEDLSRVRQLNERGLAPASRLSEARQALLLVSSRVLSVQDSVAQYTLDRDQLEEDLATFDERFQQPLVAERSTAMATIWSLESKLAAARRSLALNGQTVEAFGVTLTPKVTISIVRAGGPTAATLDTALRPGDVVEVDVAYDYGALALSPTAAAAAAPAEGNGPALSPLPAAGGAAGGEAPPAEIPAAALPAAPAIAADTEATAETEAAADTGAADTAPPETDAPPLDPVDAELPPPAADAPDEAATAREPAPDLRATLDDPLPPDVAAAPDDPGAAATEVPLPPRRPF